MTGNKTAAVDFVTVNNGAVELSVAVSGSGPLIVCAHGFPELWYSWRHQIAILRHWVFG